MEWHLSAGRHLLTARTTLKTEERTNEASSAKIILQPKGSEYVEWHAYRGSCSLNGEGFQKPAKAPLKIALEGHTSLNKSTPRSCPPYSQAFCLLLIGGRFECFVRQPQIWMSNVHPTTSGLCNAC